MGELTDVLERLEQHLRVRGARVTEVAHPGIGAGRIDQLLAPLGLSASDSLREWFGWHDGAGEAGALSAECELAPGCELHPAEVLVAEYVQARATSDLLAAGPQAVWPAELMWRATWFPVLRLFGKGLVAVDLVDDAVHVVWWDAHPDDRQRVRWPSLLAFAHDLESRYRTGVLTVGEDGFVQGPVPDHP